MRRGVDYESGQSLIGKLEAGIIVGADSSNNTESTNMPGFGVQHKISLVAQMKE